MTHAELIAKAEEIKASCAHWKSCQDGSYECALDAAGYYSTLAAARAITPDPYFERAARLLAELNRELEETKPPEPETDK